MQTSKSFLRDNSTNNNNIPNNGAGSQPQRVATFSSQQTFISKYGSFMTALDKSARQTNTFVTADDQSQISKI